MYKILCKANKTCHNLCVEKGNLYHGTLDSKRKQIFVYNVDNDLMCDMETFNNMFCVLKMRKLKEV